MCSTHTSTHRIACYLLNPYVPASIERVTRVSVDGYSDRSRSVEVNIY